MEKPLTLEELKATNYLWMACAGTLKAIDGGGAKWDNFLRPTKMKILCITEKETTRSIFDQYSYIKISVVGWAEQLDYRVTIYGHIEKKSTTIIGLAEEDILDEWLDQVRKLLRDTWSGINNNNLNCVLKKYLLDNEYEYFNTRYPELLV